MGKTSLVLDMVDAYYVQVHDSGKRLIFPSNTAVAQRTATCLVCGRLHALNMLELRPRRPLIIYIRPCKFFSVFLVMRPHWFSPIPEKKKKVRFPICCVESHHELSAPVPSPPLDDLLVEPAALPRAKRSRATFSAHQDLQRGADLRKKERREKRQTGVDSMTSLLLIVLIQRR